MLEHPENILVRLPTWVGDVVMATPALRAIHRAHPAARIVVEGKPYLRGLMRGLPYATEFVDMPGRGLLDVVRRARGIRGERFDWAVLLADSSSSALPPFLARTPVRAGYAREPARRMMLTHPLDVPIQDGKRVPVPMVERYLRLSRALGCEDRGDETELAVEADADTDLARRLEREGIGSGAELLVVTPGASFGSSKLWPPEHFAEACDGIAREIGLEVVFAPGPGEEAIARDAVGRMQERGLVLCDPIISLSELKSLIARAALVLSNDTGPRAMAVALGRPVVVLMGPTDPRHTAMHLERQRVLREEVDCSPCHLKVCPIDHRCMTRLHPDRALSAARELLR